MPNTLLLELDTWDLCVDTAGNIAVATEPYALAQDVASAIKTFKGEVYYDASIGIPYNEEILGMTPPLSLVRDYLVQAALSVENVTSAVANIDLGRNRKLTGSVDFVDINGNAQKIGL